ncbi:MAG TPA: FtsX-like permease family protein, partial [Vicinamibacterales bacterium]
SDRGDAGSRERTALRNLLIASEVALSIVLVVGAVLLARSLMRLETVDPGFAPDRSIAFTIALPGGRYPDVDKRFAAFNEIEQRLRQQRGVKAAGASSTIALRGTTWSGDATIEGRAPSDYERELQHASVTPGYFAASGGRLLAGRFLDEHDTRDKPPVALVNETLARQYFRGQPAVGKRITFGRPTDTSAWREIVGVVADEKQEGIDAPVKPEAYTPIAQQMQNPMTFVVRSSLDAESAIAMAREQVHGVDKDLALTDVTTLADLKDDSLTPERFRTTLLSTFATVALALAALGIYGVLAYFVTARRRELGIRLALGARPAEVFGLVVRQGMRPVLAGAAIGTAAALALTRLAQSLIFGIDALDPVNYVVALAVLGSIALVACALPALRATRVDPLHALRNAD